MRVLHVTHQYPPAIGGSEKYIADLSEALEARGHTVDVFTSRSLDYRTWKTELPPHEERNGVDIRRFRSMRRTGVVWDILDWALRKYWSTGSALYEPFIMLGGGPICPGMFTAILARASAYDLVHLNCLVYGHAAYGYAAARLRHVPIVVTPHAHTEQPNTHAIGYQMRVLQGSDHVIAVTEAERAFLCQKGLSPRRVTTAGNGLRLESYPRRDALACRRLLGLPDDAFVVLFLGRQVEYKGLGTTVEAFRRLRARNPRVHLLVVGPETDFSRRLFAGLGDRSGIVNLGRVSDDVRLDALNACDCLVLPSRGEAFGIVFLEAWLMGKPVIGPRSAAVETVITDGRDGFLVPVGDPRAVEVALERWISEPSLARKMGVKGRERVLERYTTSRIADIVEGVYLRTLRARSNDGLSLSAESPGGA